MGNIFAHLLSTFDASMIVKHEEQLKLWKKK